jgi:hypothetical protein
MNSLCLTLLNASVHMYNSVFARKSISHGGAARQFCPPGSMQDYRWDSSTYKATPLQCLPHQAYVQDMAKLGLVDIALERLQEMSDQSNQKQQYDTDAMQWVVEHMNFKPCKDVQFFQMNSIASALIINTHTTDGNQSLCSVTSAQVQSDLGRAQEDFHMLAIRLQELAPNHTIFDETAFFDEVMDELESLGSQHSQRMHKL